MAVRRVTGRGPVLCQGMKRRRGPAGVSERVDYGEAELVRDPDRPTGWTLLLDGVPQSYVDADDATRLEFGYLRRLAAVLDTAAAPGEPLRVLHLGGGALTLPRYLAASRPGSSQRVVELDAALTRLVRRVLPLPRGTKLRIWATEARAAVESSAAGRFQVVVNDVYRGARMPAQLTTVEFAAEVARVLRPGGWYGVNVADRPPLASTRRQAATLRAVFSDVALLAEPAVLWGRRAGNLVLVAAAGGRLPAASFAAAAARDPVPVRLLYGDELDRFVAGARVVTDPSAAAVSASPGLQLAHGEPGRDGQHQDLDRK